MHELTPIMAEIIFMAEIALIQEKMNQAIRQCEMDKLENKLQGEFVGNVDELIDHR